MGFLFYWPPWFSPVLIIDYLLGGIPLYSEPFFSKRTWTLYTYVVSNVSNFLSWLFRVRWLSFHLETVILVPKHNDPSPYPSWVNTSKNLRSTFSTLEYKTVSSSSVNNNTLGTDPWYVPYTVPEAGVFLLPPTDFVKGLLGVCFKLVESYDPETKLMVGRWTVWVENRKRRN